MYELWQIHVVVWQKATQHCKNLRPHKHKKKTDQWLPGDGSGMGKGGKEGVQKAEEAVRGNGYTHYLDCSDGFMGE